MSLVRKGRDSAGVTRGVFWPSYSKQDLRSGPRLSVLERDPRPPSHTGPPLAATPSRSPAGRISACRALFMGRLFQTVRYRSVVYHTEAPEAVNDEGPEYGASLGAEPHTGNAQGAQREVRGRAKSSGLIVCCLYRNGLSLQTLAFSLTLTDKHTPQSFTWKLEPHRRK